MAKKPMRTLVAGEWYVATVVHIKDRWEDGRPKSAVLVHDDQTVHLEGGEEFMIVFAPAHMVRKQD